MTVGRESWRRRLALAAVAAVGVASLAGLRAAAGVSATEPEARASRAASVRIVGFSYRPTRLRVAPGTRVVFTNRDGVAHTATADGGAFDTRRIGPGRSTTVRLGRRGSFAYHCTIHPAMRGRVIVRAG